jgi:hypothetical protein
LDEEAEELQQMRQQQRGFERASGDDPVAAPDAAGDSSSDDAVNGDLTAAGK